MTVERPPGWATKEADKLLGIGWGNQNQGIRATLSDDIARALVEAERRGLERAAKLAQSRVVGGYMHGAAEWPDGDDIATAIRKLMEATEWIGIL